MGRTRLQTRIACALLGCVALAGRAAPTLADDGQAARTAARPNVLFIVIDDLNDWVGALQGHRDTRTPHLDALAARGALFTNAHAAAPSCTPSRAAALFGIRPSTSGIYHNQQAMRASPALRDAVSLPQHFRGSGYVAMGSGKLFGVGKADPGSWDVYAPALDQETFPAVFDEPLDHNGLGRGYFDWGEIPIERVHEMADSRTVDWVVEQLGKAHDAPRFLACGIFRPHLPWYVPREFLDRHAPSPSNRPRVPSNDLDDVPPAVVQMVRRSGLHAAVVEAGLWDEAVQGYLASIEYADRQLGRVIRALDRGPMAKGTIVVLWSDHGWHLGEKEHWKKFTLWERATRVPLVVVAPGVTEPGMRIDEPVNLVDLYPTLIELARLAPLGVLEGTSLVPLLSKPDARASAPSLTTLGPGSHSVRSRDFRYTRYADGSEELYDHRSDPGEWKNLAGDPQYRSLKRDLGSWLPRTNAPSVEP